MRILVPAMALVMAATLVGCRTTTGETASSAKDIADFNSDNFNSGNTFEDLVNPRWLLNGEHATEQTGAVETQAWLSRVDTYAEAREFDNYVVSQRVLAERPDRIDAINSDLAELLTRDHPSTNGYTKEEAELLYRQLVGQDQVRQHSNYSPNRHGVNVGFCFGRAMIVHSIAKNAFMGSGEEAIDKRSVPARKIWVTGPMGMWKHHVATMVMAQEAETGFWVIDNYVGRVVSAADWIDVLKSRHSGVDVMFHVSRANRFSEANSMRYYQVMLDDNWFEGFFQDFLTTNVPMIRDMGGIDLTKTPAELRALHAAGQEDPTDEPTADEDDEEGEDEEIVEDTDSEDLMGVQPPTRPNDAAPGEGVM